MTTIALGILGYLDPGTGSIILQVIVALILGAGVAFRNFITAPFRFFRKSTAETDASVTEEVEEE